MFDPIHCGHLDVASAAQDALDLEQMLMVPSSIPPHRPQPIASSYHRFAMVALAIAGRRRWQVLDIELRERAASYTADTLRDLHRDGYRPEELFFIAGVDAFAEIASWKDYPALFDLSHFAVVSRPGFPVDSVPARMRAFEARMHRVRRGQEAAPLKPDTTREEGSVRLRPDTTYPTLIYLIDAPTANVSSTAIRGALSNGEPIAGLVPLPVQQHIEQHALYSRSAPADEAGADVVNRPAGRLHGQD
jgi:nicotinate-nucleotide adenylyltransferase